MENRSMFQLALNNGLMAGIILTVTSLVFYLLGLSTPEAQQGWAGKVSILLMIGVFAWATHKAVSEDKAQGSEVSFGRSLGFGTLVGLISGGVSFLYTYVFSAFIDPSMVKDVKKNAIRQMEQAGNSEEQIEQAMEYAGMFMTPTAMAIIALIFSVFIGFLVGIGAGFFMKSSKTSA